MSLTPQERDVLIREMCRQNIAVVVEPWSNFMGTLNHDAVIVEVKNVEELQTLHRFLHRENNYRKPAITLRAAAGYRDKESACCCFFKQRQEERYNESFSFSPGAVADVIVRFSPAFGKGKMAIEPYKGSEKLARNRIQQLPKHLVTVPAGVQIKELADFLHKKKLSLETVSMIPYVTAVGLAMTAGHGTGRDAPSFAGLIREITIVKADGALVTVKEDQPLFAAIVGGQAGLFGTVVSLKLECVDAFKLQEDIHNYARLDALADNLQSLMKNNQYFTLMHIPTYLPESLDSHIGNWHVRTWNFSEAKSTVKKPTYQLGAELITQELGVKASVPVLEGLLNESLNDLLPAYMSLVAKAVIEMRGESRQVGSEHFMTHYQSAFPKRLTDLSFLIPVDDDSAGQILSAHLAQIDKLLVEAKAKGEYPVTYAVYARYYKGTNGGLSTSRTDSDKQRILALEVVSHPNAPGLKSFERQLIDYFSAQAIKPRYHLGKDIPPELNYADFLGHAAVAEVKEALTKWYGDEEKMAQSALITPYFQQMLGDIPKARLFAAPPQSETLQTSHVEGDKQFLRQLMTSLKAFQHEHPCLKKGAFASQLHDFEQAVEDKQHELERLSFGSVV